MCERDLRRLFLLANAFKEGDVALGGTADDRLRADARQARIIAQTGRPW